MPLVVQFFSLAAVFIVLIQLALCSALLRHNVQSMFKNMRDFGHFTPNKLNDVGGSQVEVL